MTRKEFHAVPRKNNTSGCTGVKYEQWEGRGYWRAFVRVGPKFITRNFSVKKYGHDKARALAIEARKALVEYVHGYHLGGSAEAKSHVEDLVEQKSRVG